MLKSNTAPVAVFDSGLGGIGVLREIRKILPHENLLYFGDTANAPYGERTHDEIKALVLGHAARLLCRAKALVLACNTATAVAVDTLRNAYPHTPIIGIEPAIKPATLVKKHPVVLILATEVTLREGKLAALLGEFAERATFIRCAAPGLVRLVEQGHLDDTLTAEYLLACLGPILADTAPDAVVLGCTHFPFAAPAISRFLGDDVPLFDGAVGTARELARRLRVARLCNRQAKHGTLVLHAGSVASLAVMRQLL